MSFLKHNSSLNTILFHSSSFFNMFQSPPKDFSHMGLLFHFPSWGSQAITFALPTNAFAIDRPSLFHQIRRDVRAVQWSNDALSTLLDLYEEKYLAFGHGSFLIKDWEDIQKKLVTHILTENVRTTTQCHDKWDKMKKKYFQKKIVEGVTSSITTSWIWFDRMNQILEGATKVDDTPMDLIRVMFMLDLFKHWPLKNIYQMMI